MKVKDNKGVDRSLRNTHGQVSVLYPKIPKISPGAHIFQRSFLRGLFLEGLIYRGKFAFQNRLGSPYIWK